MVFKDITAYKIYFDFQGKTYQYEKKGMLYDEAQTKVNYLNEIVVSGAIFYKLPYRTFRNVQISEEDNPTLLNVEIPFFNLVSQKVKGTNQHRYIYKPLPNSKWVIETQKNIIYNKQFPDNKFPSQGHKIKDYGLYKELSAIWTVAPSQKGFKFLGQQLKEHHPKHKPAKYGNERNFNKSLFDFMVHLIVKENLYLVQCKNGKVIPYWKKIKKLAKLIVYKNKDKFLK